MRKTRKCAFCGKEFTCNSDKHQNYTFKIVALLCKISRSETLFLVKYRILMLCFYVKYRVLRFFFVSLHPKYHRYG